MSLHRRQIAILLACCSAQLVIPFAVNAVLGAPTPAVGRREGCGACADPGTGPAAAQRPASGTTCAIDVAREAP